MGTGMDTGFWWVGNLVPIPITIPVAKPMKPTGIPVPVTFTNHWFAPAFEGRYYVLEQILLTCSVSDPAGCWPLSHLYCCFISPQYCVPVPVLILLYLEKALLDHLHSQKGFSISNSSVMTSHVSNLLNLALRDTINIGNGTGFCNPYRSRVRVLASTGAGTDSPTHEL